MELVLRTTPVDNQQARQSKREIGYLELMRESLVAVVNEMRANIIHSSYSSIIYEGHDFSCALLTADGRLIAQSLADHPLHIFAVPYSAVEVLKSFKDDIHEGDIFLHNDPYSGGTHLNDILMLYPVFNEGRLGLFAATRCHWGDVGGMTPGSLSGRVREIYQEGLRIVPTRICERGRMNDAFLSLLFENTRIPDERRGDFNAMLGTSRKAAQHLHRLFARFDAAELLNGIEELIARSELVMRKGIRAIPDGTYFAEAYLDNDGHSNEPLLGVLRLTVRDDTITADFTGTSPQTMGPLNVGPAMALNSVATVVKSFLDPNSSINHGSFRPIEIINPSGSFLNATHPAPCGGMAECRALITALVVTALGQAMPEKRVGDLKGGANHVYVSGLNDRRDRFLLYEYPAGGTGATLGVDGNNGVRAFNEGDFNAVWAIEILEAQCPIRVEHYSIREGSAGDGKFRGGFGVRRDLRVLKSGALLSVLADHCVIPPFGVATGRGGAANRFTVLREGKPIETSPTPGKIGGFQLLANDIVSIETAGGGGYGDPFDRDLLKVKKDVSLGLLTVEQARLRYGLVMSSSGCVEQGMSECARRQLRTERVTMPVQRASADKFEGTRRRLSIPSDVATRLRIAPGDLIELVTESCGATLRAWAVIGGRGTSLAVGPRGMDILGSREGDPIEIRAVIPHPE